MTVPGSFGEGLAQFSMSGAHSRSVVGCEAVPRACDGGTALGQARSMRCRRHPRPVEVVPARQPFGRTVPALPSIRRKAVRAEIQSAMNMVTFGWEDGGSPELERARGVAAACAEAETDPDLRAAFETARARFEKDATWIRRQHEQDEDQDDE